MAKLKMLKYPRKPKTMASVASKEKYLVRCKEIDKENGRRKSENKKSEDLSKKIAGLKPVR
ncbi:MAG: hypothetical protein LBS50_08680 [Prevotellaceae bacterium]|jgi:hypothetical protein|nr:hypothetical protein [Prevotellaceae bacterium]